MIKIKWNIVFFKGTIKQNKIEIPKEFLRGSKTNKREVDSSLFAFKDYLTLVSFVPKKNKAVVLVSLKHHEAKIDKNTMKPQIIMDYNKYKGWKYTYCPKLINKFWLIFRWRRYLRSTNWLEFLLPKNQ